MTTGQTPLSENQSNDQTRFSKTLSFYNWLLFCQWDESYPFQNSLQTGFGFRTTRCKSFKPHCQFKPP